MQVCSHAGASAGLLAGDAGGLVRLQQPVPVRLEWRPRRSTPPSSIWKRGLQLGAARVLFHRLTFHASITKVSPAHFSLWIGLLK